MGKGNLQKLEIKINKKENCVIASINPAIYNINAIYSACYALIDKLYVHIDGDPNISILVNLKPKNNNKEKINLKNLAMEFENELVKHAFYHKQNSEALALKVIMLKKILALTDQHAEVYVDSESKKRLDNASELLNDPLNDFDDEIDDDFLDDPEGIAIPWEEKYGKKQNDKKQKKSTKKKK